MSKKGFLGVGDVFAILFLAMVLIGFYWYFFIGGTITKVVGGIPEEEMISSDLGVESVRYSALLQTIVENPLFKDENIAISDLIVWSAIQEDYDSLEEEFIEIFEDTDSYWYIGIYGYKGEESFKHTMARKDERTNVYGRYDRYTYDKFVIIPGYGEISDISVQIRIVDGVYS